ncbi:asparagine synthase (glutamine-hydrolyzing) [Sorangium cellulosum]|uniref:asparagine synthase (glutamine-hydrolyzing) n=1 Tax=Sorangium cellulosum TaxID=56 RepID=UPI0002E87154|nr:asparagine synthase (glutamine-hydrolyzing) [Sorangium cellulosum]
MFQEELSPEARRDCVVRMLARLRHRGPDEMGYYFDDSVAIGNARLSIVDLAGGQQPIGDPTGRYWIVFNGEIYNYKELGAELAAAGHRFASSSDTEVLLHAWIAWGPAAFTRLNGAFAFCIYDRRDKTLVLARDRFGKRPLYYVRDAEGVVFGSELKCFLEYEPFRFELDPGQLASIFRIWTPLEDQCGFRSVRQVPAGAYAQVTGSSFDIVHYAPLRIDRPPPDLSEQEAAAQVRDALSKSVQLRLRSDVEVGTYLSGGIDSAIVATLIAENSTGRTKSFSIRFEEDEFDESGDQELMSSFLGTEHASIRIGSQEIVDAFPEALWHAEVPVFRTAFVPMFLLSRLVKDHGIKVVLTGEGADEAFLGYDIFRETLLRAEWAEMEPAARQRKLSRLYPYLRQFDERNHAALAALFERLSRDPPTDFFSHELRFLNSQLSARLLAGRHDALRPLTEHVAAPHERYAPLSRVQKAQWLEFKTLLAGYLLSTQGDRMSLAHGVENRCPFLDPDVVALGCATSLAFDDGFDEKYLLKKAFAAKLPERILKKPKQPYRAPDASAFLKRQPDYLSVIRSKAELEKIGVLDVKFCAAFVERMLSKPAESISQAENQTFLFLLSTALLHRRFVERDVPAPPTIEPLLVRRFDGRLIA